MSKPIKFDSTFKKNYNKRIRVNKKLRNLYKISLELFISDPLHIHLRNHKLKGNMRGRCAFLVDDDCRVVYVEMTDRIIFLDIGKHKEVYK